MKQGRTPVIAGNWKMHKDRDEALQFIYKVNEEVPSNDLVETVICISDVLLRCLVKRQGQLKNRRSKHAFEEKEHLQVKHHQEF